MADRDWSKGYSPAQNRRFARIKPAAAKAKQEVEAKYDDSPEEFYNRLFVGLPEEQRAMMEDVMSRLPEDQRFETLGGLMSLIGYGTGDNRATISRYKLSNTPKSEDLALPTVLGYYPVTGAPADPLGSSPMAYKDKGKLLAWYAGESSPQPGAGIAVFDPDQTGEQARKYKENALRVSGNYGPYTGGIPSTVWHELAHRGFDSPAANAFSEEVSPGFALPSNEHLVLAALGEGAKGDPDYEHVRDRYSRSATALNDWITPERENQYGITKYHTPDYSILEYIIKLLRDE